MEPSALPTESEPKTVVPSPEPTKPSDPARELDDVLRTINRIRTEYGADPLYELPTGSPAFNDGSCVLENAFADIGVSFVDYTYGLGRKIQFRHGLEHFIRDFDAGRYPHLISG